MLEKKQQDIRFVLRLKPELHSRVLTFATQEQRSLNNQIAVILASWFDPKALRDRVVELERAR